jgi:hypothetical protein
MKSMIFTRNWKLIAIIKNTYKIWIRVGKKLTIQWKSNFAHINISPFVGHGEDRDFGFIVLRWVVTEIIDCKFPIDFLWDFVDFYWR